MKLKSTLLLTLTLLSCTLQPLAASHKKCVLFGIKGVLLYPDLKKISFGSLGSKIGLTPEKGEKDLFEAVSPIQVANFPIWTETYPALIEAWLTGYKSNSQVHDIAYHYVKKHYSFVKKMILEKTVDVAFSNEQAKTFSAYSDTLSLARHCKSAGHTIALCSSWNKESFDNLMYVQSGALGFFDTSYISCDCGMLAAVPAFYDPIINEYGKDYIVLIDSLPENIRAAKARGIKTISFTSATAAERELKKMGFLS